MNSFQLFSELSILGPQLRGSRRQEGPHPVGRPEGLRRQAQDHVALQEGQELRRHCQRPRLRLLPGQLSELPLVLQHLYFYRPDRS